MPEPDVTISNAVAKYLVAILLDPKQLHADGQMAVFAREQLSRKLFGQNAEFVSVEDAGPLVYEAMRETVWAS